MTLLGRRPAAERRMGAVEPGSHPLRGLESPGVARLLDHPLDLADEARDAEHALAVVLTEHLGVAQLAIDRRGGQPERLVELGLADRHVLRDPLHHRGGHAALHQPDAVHRVEVVERAERRSGSARRLPDRATVGAAG